MQVAAKFTHRPDSHQASAKAPVSLTLSYDRTVSPANKAFPESRPRRLRRLMSLGLPLVVGFRDIMRRNKQAHRQKSAWVLNTTLTATFPL